MNSKLGIYIHIPFCAKKCGYCDFYSVPGGDSLFDAYAGALTAHFAEYAPLVSGCEADTVYIGGGTPTILGAKRLDKILRELRRCFKVSDKAEITTEANPESLDAKTAEKLLRAGINRLSVGVQSFDDDELSALGRIHTAEKAKTAVRAARDAGFSNISLDLMYGLPAQTPESFFTTLREAAALSPQHISCYCLKLEPGTPMHSLSPALPSDEAQLETYLGAVARLAQQGYGQYEISNFAQRGRRCAHNLKYWNLDEYIGFGAAAHSFFGGIRFSFVRDVTEYIKNIGVRGLLVDEAEDTPAPPSGRPGEYIMLRLRLADGVDEDVFLRLFGLDFSPYADRLQKYIDGGFAARSGTAYRLTPKGMFVSNTIIADLLSI